MAPYIASGFVTYVDWSHKLPYTVQGTQEAAYADAAKKSNATWMIFTGYSAQPAIRLHILHFRVASLAFWRYKTSREHTN